MNNYKELIDRLTNGTDMPGYDEGDALDWYSHITDEAADAIKQLVAGRDELVAALEKIADTDPDEGTVWFHSIADSALAKLGAGGTARREVLDELVRLGQEAGEYDAEPEGHNV